ncbi:hypothetical protein Tco_0848982 [Tanacetum coccineum]
MTNLHYSPSLLHQFDYCEICVGPHYSYDCQAGNAPVYDQGPCYNQNFSDDQPPFYSLDQQQQFDYCEVCGGPHYSSDCQTKNQLVYEPNPGNNYDFPCFEQPPQYHIDQFPPQDLESHRHFILLARENNCIFEELLRTLKTNSIIGEPAGSNDFTESSVDDLVPIPRESESTLDSTDLECSMPIIPPLPCTDVLGDTIVDIGLLLGEHLDTLSMGDRKIDFNPIRDIDRTVTSR